MEKITSNARTVRRRLLGSIKAAATGSPISFADRNFGCTLFDRDPVTGQRKFTVNNLTDKLVFNGSTPLGGDYQTKNIQTVCQVFKILEPEFRTGETCIKRGIRRVVMNTGLEGRWQVIGKNPLTICDTAHNKEGLDYVLRQIKRMSFTDLHIVIGFVSDKDITRILPMFPADAHYYFTRAQVLRALDEKALRLKASEYGLTGDSYPEAKEALIAARSKASDSGLVFVGGSTFIVAEVI